MGGGGKATGGKGRDRLDARCIIASSSSLTLPPSFMGCLSSGR